MRERRLGDLVERRRKLVDPPVRERGEILHRAAKRCERSAPRFVGHRHGHLAASGERLQERPLGSGQILEAVREDGLAAPGVELAGNPVGGVPPKQVAVPEVEPIELGAIRGVEPGELAFEIVRIEQARLELAHRREQCVCEAAEASRAAEAVERLPGERAPDDQRLLRLGRDLPAARSRHARCA